MSLYNDTRKHGGHHHHQYVTNGGSNNRSKFTTRHLAALNFLLSVPMQREPDLREAGMKFSTRMRVDEDNDAEVEEVDVRQLDQEADDESGATSVTDTDNFNPFIGQNGSQAPVDAAGIKLKGPSVHAVHHPAHLRYSFNNLSEHSAVARTWEENVMRAGSAAHAHVFTGDKPSLLSSRLFMCRSRNYPNMVASTVRYDAGEEKAKLEKMKAEDTKGLEVFRLPERDWRGCSYKNLFRPLSEQILPTNYVSGAIVPVVMSVGSENFSNGSVGPERGSTLTQPSTTGQMAVSSDASHAFSAVGMIGVSAVDVTSTSVSVTSVPWNPGNDPSIGSLVQQQNRHVSSHGYNHHLESPEDLAVNQVLELGYAYDPNSVDDPGLLHGSHRYVSQRRAPTGPIISSVILFVKKQELKQNLNEQFRERHPHLPPSLTLSKIRNLKKQALLAAYSIGIEVSTVALAVLNFERLCLKSIITKFNRRLAMALSLLLAYKFNENISEEYYKKLHSLLHFFDREWNLPKKQVFDAEFGAFVVLGFSMHLPYKHLYLSFTRLLKLIGQSNKQYLGENMNEVYFSDILRLER